MAAEKAATTAKFPFDVAWSNSCSADVEGTNASQLLSSLALALGTHQNPFEEESVSTSAELHPPADVLNYVALAAALRTPDFVGSFEAAWNASSTAGGEQKSRGKLRRQSSATKSSSHEEMWSASGNTAALQSASGETACSACLERGLRAGSRAAYIGHLACLKALAVSGHDSIFSTDDLGRTCLFYAAASPHKIAQTDCLRLLLSIDDDWIDVGDHSGDTPLAVSACRGRADAVNELLASGAKANLSNKSGQTALHACSDSACLQALLQFTEQDLLYAVDQQGRSALFLCSALGNAACLNLLIAADAEKGTLYLSEEEHGDSPLHAAAASGSVECVRALLGHLELPGLPTNLQGETPVEVAFHAGHIRLAILLLQYEAWLSGDEHAVATCTEHLRTIGDLLSTQQEEQPLGIAAHGGKVGKVHIDEQPSAFQLDKLAVSVASPPTSPKRLQVPPPVEASPQLAAAAAAPPRSPTGRSAIAQAAWLTKGKIPQIQSNGQQNVQRDGQAPAVLPGFSQLRSSKLRLPPLQQGPPKALPAIITEETPAAVVIPERRLSGASSVHSRRQSLARQRSLKAAALVELSPMPRQGPLF